MSSSSRRKKRQPKRQPVYDSDSEDSYAPSDKAPSPPLNTPASRPQSYNLRDSSQIKRPGRYRVDDPIGPLTHPLFIHERPPFNEDLARLIPWNTVPLDHPGPLSSDMAYERLLAERERKKNEPPRAADAPPDVEFRPFQHVLDGSQKRPCVAHLSRKEPREDPIGYLYTADESIVDNTKFHPPSDKWSYRDEYEAMFSLDDDDEDESQRELERRAYVVSFPSRLHLLSFIFQSRVSNPSHCRRPLQMANILIFNHRTGHPSLTASSGP